MMHTAARYVPTPFGRLLLGVCDDALIFCIWEAALARNTYHVLDNNRLHFSSAHELLDLAECEIIAFLSARQRFLTVPFDFIGSPFQRDVLRATSAIGYGTTATYSDIARAIKRPGASRAVGNALALNPLSLFIPCHRVVPASGGFGNYAGGRQVKAQLISLERHNTVP